jgi:ankyrin repeat protein
MPASTVRWMLAVALLAALPDFTSFAQERTPEGATTMLTQADRDEMLINAVKAGDAEKARILLAHYEREGRSLPTDKYDGSLLHVAASHGSETVLPLLLEAGLSPNVIGFGGATPLHHAASSNQPRMVALLIAAGADVNARTTRGLTPLHVSHGTTQVLLDADADAMAQDENGETAIFHAGPDLAALVKAGLDVNARNKSGWTPLHVAAFTAATEQAKALLDLGADIEAKTGAEYVIRSKDAWGTESRTIPAGYTALDIAYNEHDRVKWVTGRNRPMIDLLRARGATKPFLGIRFLRW